MIKPDTYARVWRLGEEVVGLYAHGNAAIDDRAVMWALLCHATRVSRRSYKGPPRSGYPSAALGAAMIADDVSAWHQVAGYLRGELSEKEVAQTRPPAPSAIEITACELVLKLYHEHALRAAGDWKRMRAAIYMRACGSPPRAVVAATGLNRHRLRHAQDAAMGDMLEAWRRLTPDLRKCAKSGSYHDMMG